MLLTAIWNILSKLEPYSAEGYLADKFTKHSVVITKAQALALLRQRGYIFKDEGTPAPACPFVLSCFFAAVPAVALLCPFGGCLGYYSVSILFPFKMAVLPHSAVLSSSSEKLISARS